MSAGPIGWCKPCGTAVSVEQPVSFFPVERPGLGSIFNAIRAEAATSVITELFESNYHMLVRYSFRATHDRNVAEDVVQQALMMLYKNIRQGTVIDNPKAWTFCVIRRLISKHARTDRCRTALNEPLSVLDDSPARALSAVDAGMGLEDVTKLYSVLTPREKDVILLRMTSLKYREIADQLKISPKSVNTLLARALRKLQRAAGAKSGHECAESTDKKTLH
jgi:RNA polymerase sigma factor (sigma-70 family)